MVNTKVAQKTSQSIPVTGVSGEVQNHLFLQPLECQLGDLTIQGHGSRMNLDPSSPKVQALLAMHFMAQSAPAIRRKIQKATAGFQTPKNDLLQLAYLVFNNKYMAKNAERTERNMQKVQMIAVVLSAQRPPTARPAFPGPLGP